VGSFPARNALIAGLSQAVVITEGAVDSGSLITAEYAKKFSRPLFAVPGPITSSLSKGSNSLLKNGAVAVMSAQDILDSLGIMIVQKSAKTQGKEVTGDTKEEQKVLDLLQNNPLHFDEIVRKMEKDSKSVGSLLSLMELKGLLKNNTDGTYTL
jgi:DNA processing protein